MKYDPHFAIRGLHFDTSSVCIQLMTWKTLLWLNKCRNLRSFFHMCSKEKQIQPMSQRANTAIVDLGFSSTGWPGVSPRPS